MQSIVTTYHGPTNTRGSRIYARATGGAGSISIPYPHELSSEAAHDKAAVALCKKLGWKGRLARGSAPGGKGNMYVFLYGDELTVTDPRRRRRFRPSQARGIERELFGISDPRRRGKKKARKSRGRRRR